MISKLLSPLDERIPKLWLSIAGRLWPIYGNYRALTKKQWNKNCAKFKRKGLSRFGLPYRGRYRPPS